MVIDVAVPLWMYPVLIWTISWKAVGAWKAAKKEHLVWFIAFFVFNTFGILPIVYLLFFQKMNSYVKSKKIIKKNTSKKVVKKKFPSLFK